MELASALSCSNYGDGYDNAKKDNAKHNTACYIRAQYAFRLWVLDVYRLMCVMCVCVRVCVFVCVCVFVFVCVCACVRV